MITIETASAQGRVLDFLIGLSEGGKFIEAENIWRWPLNGNRISVETPNYSSNMWGTPASGGFLIDREGISIKAFSWVDQSGHTVRRWQASLPCESGEAIAVSGDSSLMAACRAWAIRKLGPEVQVPETASQIAFDLGTPVRLRLRG